MKLTLGKLELTKAQVTLLEKAYGICARLAKADDSKPAELAATNLELVLREYDREGK